MSAIGQEHPTETTPDVGQVLVGDVVLSDAEHFVDEDGVHAIRSVEFSIAAYDEDFQEAVATFIDAAADYLNHLTALIDQGTAQPQEIAEAALIASRFQRALAESERYMDEMEAVLKSQVEHQRRLSSGGTALPIRPARGWRQPTKPKTSSAPAAG